MSGTGTVPVTLRVQVNSALPLTLPFPSGQEYDLALTDSSGNSLWTWSSSRTFVRMAHQRTVTDEWSETVEIPWPAAPGGGVQPGDYSVEAWITTAGSPAFAGTVPVRIAAPQ